MTEPLKQFANVDDHLKILSERGMNIEDHDKAKRYLENVGYFRLSAYWHNERTITLDNKGNPLLGDSGVVREDSFIDNTSFESVLSLYIFDRQLRIIILDAIQRVEISVRSQLVKTLGSIDRQAHKKLILGCYRSNFLKEDKYGNVGWDIWQSKHEALLSASAKERFIKHQVDKFGTLEQIPVWVAAEVWDFGCTSHLLAGLAPRHAQDVATYFGVNDGDVLISWMKTFNFVRNICAHHRRLWNRRVTKQPKLIKPEENDLLAHLWDTSVLVPQPLNNKVYSVMCLLQYLMKTISPRSKWFLKVHNLTANFNNFQEHAESMGFPKDWEKLELWS